MNSTLGTSLGGFSHDDKTYEKVIFCWTIENFDQYIIRKDKFATVKLNSPWLYSGISVAKPCEWRIGIEAVNPSRGSLVDSSGEINLAINWQVNFLRSDKAPSSGELTASIGIIADFANNEGNYIQTEINPVPQENEDEDDDEEFILKQILVRQNDPPMKYRNNIKGSACSNIEYKLMKSEQHTYLFNGNLHVQFTLIIYGDLGTFWNSRNNIKHVVYTNSTFTISASTAAQLRDDELFGRPNKIAKLEFCEKLMESLWESKEGSDLEISLSNGELVKLHKNILSKESPVLLTMFKFNEKTNEENLKIEDASPEIMKKFFKYLYTGDFAVGCWKEAEELLYVAEKYLVKDLKQKIFTEMVTISEINLKNFTSFATLAFKFQASQETKLFLAAFFKTNRDYLIMSKKFTEEFHRDPNFLRNLKNAALDTTFEDLIRY